MAVSRSASAVATSASRLMRATSGLPMLVMYSFLSRTSLMVNEMTSSPILLMSSAQVARMRSPDHLGLLHDFFHRELSDDAAQVAFHHQPDQAFALLVGLGQELLRRGEDRLDVRLHLDLRDGFDGHRDALLGVEILLRRHVERHQFERKFAADLHHRPYDGAVAFDHPRSADAVNDERLMRACLAIEPGQKTEQEHDRPGHPTRRRPRFQWNPERHISSYPNSNRTVRYECAECFILSRSRTVRAGSLVPKKTSPSSVVMCTTSFPQT